MELGKQIYELRKKANLSQEQLAEKVGVSRQTISKWELGETAPDIKQAQILSQIFNISLDELTGNDTKEVIYEKVSNTEKLAGLIIKIIKIWGIIILACLIIAVVGIILFGYVREEGSVEFENNVEKVTFTEVVGEETYRYNIAPTTYSTYQGMIEARLYPYFEENQISVKDVTGDELNAYYNYLFEEGLSGCTAQKHHNLLHLAFKHAMKKRIIPFNPCDQANRPKAVKYVASYYNETKLKELLMALRDDPLRIVVMLTIYYGVRRSEVLGIKWSAIDYDEELIHLRHKVIEDKSNGKTVIRGMDIMKSKSSMRSLPLMTFICEELRKEKERQEEMKKVLRNSYNRKYEDYVCVDSMGNLLKPNYVTNHFAVLLRRHGLDKIRFHDLRHSCATLMLSNGEDMKKIQGWLGHSTITITADTYAHLDAESKRGSASVIENALAITA